MGSPTSEFSEFYEAIQDLPERDRVSIGIYMALREFFSLCESSFVDE
jgi:hypothetical protein